MLLRFVLSFLMFMSFSYALSVTDSSNDSIIVKSNNKIFNNSTLYTHKKLLLCTPTIDAIYKYHSANTLEVIPSLTLPSSSNYSCILNREFLNSPNDELLSFEFKTDSLDLLDWHYLPREQLLRIVFNDSINIKSATRAIKLYKLNNLAQTKLKYTISTQDNKTLLLQINEPVGDLIQLNISSALMTLSGKKLGKEIIKDIDYSSSIEVKIDKDASDMYIKDEPIMVANDDGSFSIRLFFDDTFDNKPIKEFIKLDGISSFSLNKDIYLNYKQRQKLNIKDSYYSVDIISKQFKANSKYKLTLKKGLRHYKQLKDNKVFEFETGDRKSGIIFGSDKPYLSNLGELGFSSINISKATLVLEKITHDNYRYFINYNQSDLKDIGKFTKEIFSKDITLNNPQNQIQKQKVVLKDMINSSYGLYRVTINYEDRDIDGEIINRKSSKVIFVSDIGMAVNLSQNQAFVSLLNLSDGTPIEGALVQLYSSNNILITTAKSNRDGIAILDKKALLNEKPKAIIVSTSTDKSFLLLNKSLNSVNYKTLNSSLNRYRAFVYFQSNIIRPSGTIRAMVTLKDRDFISANSLPVKITLAKLYDKPMIEDIYHTDEFGIIDFSYKMSSEDKTGFYELKVWLGDEVIGQKKISVEAFIPPKIENHIKTDKPIYIGGEFVEANISSLYLFGAPSAMLKGKVNYSAVASSYKHNDFKGYSFNNSLLGDDNDKLYIDITQDIILDANGKTTLILPTTSNQKVPSILKATIGATIMDDTQPVATYKSIFIYPYKYLVGIKANKTTLEAGDEFKATAVLIDPLNAKSIDGKLSVLIKKQNWHYSYSSGRYNWENEIEIVDSFSVDANSEFRYIIKENGEYIVEVHDRLGGHSATITVAVSGWGYTNISPTANLKKVEIKFEDKLYAKGDTLRVSLNSPILNGRILVTLEGDSVLWYKSIAIDKGSATVDIPLTVDMGRGLYLHATATRDTKTPSTLIPFRAMGYKFIKPRREESRIKILLDYNRTTNSKLTTPLRITTSRESALIVSVVDVGILNLIDQKPPEIFDYFNEQPDQKILYYDIYEKVMSYLTKGNIISFGSDMDSKKRKKHLPPENGDRVKPFMLWSNIIYTKNNQASFDLEIPEFNGKGTIVVIALDNRSIGVKSEDIVVKDDIMIKPSYPRFILVGDKIEVPIRVFNSTTTDKTLQLRQTISKNLSLSETMALASSNGGAKAPLPSFARTLVVKANSSVVVKARLEATALGKGDIVLEIKLDGKTFSKSVTLLAMSPYALQSKTYQDSISTSTTINIPPQFKNAKALINLSDNILGQLYGDLKYLVGYPYGCAEQTSSKISAMFYAKPFMREDRLLKDSNHFIRQGIKKLSNQQNGYGEFAYWEPDGYVNGYASLYASQTLLDLNASGHPLDKDVKKRIYKALNSIVKAKSSLEGKYSNSLRLYSAYILSTHNKLDSSIANMLYDKKIYTSYYISYYYMSVILQNMGKKNMASNLFNEANSMNYGDSNMDFASLSGDAFLILDLKSKHFDKKDVDFQFIKDRISKLYSTHTKALAFKALTSYFGKPINQDMRIALTLNREKEIYHKTTSFIKKLSSDYIIIDPISGIVNYTVELFKHLPYPIKNQLTTQKELSIKREFIDSKGNSVDLKNLEQGSEIYSKITIGNMKSIKNIVLNQRIPACLDIVNTRINSSKISKFKDVNLNLDYKDILDDRVLCFFSVKAKTRREVISSNPYRTIRVDVQNKTIVYTPLIATALGECHLPAVTIEAMYDSRLNDYAKQTTTVIVKTKDKISQNKELSNQERVKNLVKELYLLEEKNADPKESLAYFHFPLKNYFSRENLTPLDIVKNKEKSNKEWAKKSYKIVDITVEEENIAMQEYKVKILFDYILDSGKKSLKGRSQHLLTITYRNGQFGIDGITVVRK